MSNENKNNKLGKEKNVPEIEDKFKDNLNNKENADIKDSQELPQLDPPMRFEPYPVPRADGSGYDLNLQPVPVEPVSDENKPIPKQKDPEFPKIDGNQKNDSVPKILDPDDFVKSFRDLIGKDDFEEFLKNTNLDSQEFEESIENFFTFAKKYNENFPDIGQIDIDKLKEAFKEAQASISERDLEGIEFNGYSRE